MGTFNWCNARLNKERFSVHSPSAPLTLHRLYSNPKGTPVFLVHGFDEDHKVFMPDHADSGLAPFLADAGYDVYIAELSSSSSHNLQTSHALELRNLILEELPAHLSMVAKLRPGEPQFWAGHGLGSVLLMSCLARLDILPAPVLGVIQFGAARRCELASLPKTLSYMGWQYLMGLGSFKKDRITSLPGSGVSRSLLQGLVSWHEGSDWVDPEDGFNYRVALKTKWTPPSLYFCIANNPLWAGLNDTRLWVQELGDHDAQIITLSKQFGNKKNYSYSSMLTHPLACEDHFLQVQSWLESKKTLDGHRLTALQSA